MSQVLLNRIADLIDNQCNNKCGLEVYSEREILLEEAVPFMKLYMEFRDQPDLFKEKP